MSTLPDDIQAVAIHLYEVCKRYGLKHVKFDQYMDSTCSQNGPDQLTIEIEHPFGGVKIDKEYFCMPDQSNLVSPKVSDGVALLVKSHQERLDRQQKKIREAEESSEESRRKIEAVSLLDPSVLDQIVIALGEN